MGAVVDVILEREENRLVGVVSGRLGMIVGKGFVAKLMVGRLFVVNVVGSVVKFVSVVAKFVVVSKLEERLVADVCEQIGSDKTAGNVNGGISSNVTPIAKSLVGNSTCLGFRFAFCGFGLDSSSLS